MLSSAEFNWKDLAPGESVKLSHWEGHQAIAIRAWKDTEGNRFYSDPTGITSLDVGIEFEVDEPVALLQTTRSTDQQRILFESWLARNSKPIVDNTVLLKEKPDA